MTSKATADSKFAILRTGSSRFGRSFEDKKVHKFTPGGNAWGHLGVGPQVPGKMAVKRGHCQPSRPSPLVCRLFSHCGECLEDKASSEKKKIKEKRSNHHCRKGALAWRIRFILLLLFSEQPGSRPMRDGICAPERVSRRGRHRCSGNLNRLSGAAF